MTQEEKELYTTVFAHSNHDNAIHKINALLEERDRLISFAMGNLEWLKKADCRKGVSADAWNVISKMEDIIKIDTQIWCLQHTADLMQELININEIGEA